MAKMYPQNIDNYTYTKSEKHMFELFRDTLPEKYHVFYSVRWFENNAGKRVDSESDFIVFDPSFGFLAIEVKGGTDIVKDGENWTLIESEDGESSRRDLKCSPYEQAEKSMRHFYKYFHEEFNQSFRGAYGFAVAFPWFSAEKVFSSSSPKEVTIDINNIQRLPNVINEIFHYWKNKRNDSIPFSQDQRKRFISLINKRISLSAAAGALIPVHKKEFEKVNLIQDNILDALSNFRMVRFIGGAGTGKTFIGAKKALREAASGRKVLFTCISKELADYIQALFFNNNNNITCSDFNSLMAQVLGDRKYKTTKGGDYFDAVEEVENHILYDSIIVDEGQDYDVDKGLATRALLKEDYSSFYVFFDENQNIFSKDFDNAFSMESPPVLLRYNIRNTGKIYDKAVELSGLGKETVPNTIIGVEPEIEEYKNRAQCLKAITNIINRLADKESVPIQAITIISNLPYEDSVLNGEEEVGRFKISISAKSNTNDNSIRFSTVVDYKGMESDIIIYLCHDKKNHYDTQIDNNELYVACTRARYYLYIINISI